MLYLISGRDEYRREELVDQLKARMRQLPAGEHNVTELDSTGSVPQLITACNTSPFLCEKRMVIARGLLSQSRRGSNAAQATIAQVTEYLPSLPEETHLVLVEDDDATLQPLIPIRADTFHRQYARMRPHEIPSWISERARATRLRVSPEAARALSELAGGDLRLLAGEIEKLAAHAETGGTIDIQDVRDLVHGASPDVFAWHDAIAESRAGVALAATQRFLDEGSESAELFAQVVALVRRLFIVSELLRERRSLAHDGPSFGLSSSGFVQDKLRSQAMKLPAGYLDRAYQVLQETDLAVKLGKLDGELALEVVIAELTGIDPVRIPSLEGTR